jgi:phage anti-repressor protein
MNNLIKITVSDGKQTVNARDLHEALGVGRDFSNWIKGRIEEYGFVEGEKADYHLAKSGEVVNRPQGGGTPGDLYLLSVDMAKELAMVENNETGRKIRRYLIRIEQEHIALLESARRDHEMLQNVYRQMENYRIKYINLLDKLENNGMTVEEIWDLSRVDREALQKLRTL